MLRDCTKCRQIWLFLHLDRGPYFNIQDSCSWLWCNIDEAHGTLFAVTCWILWKARNEELFNDISWDRWYIVNQILSLHRLVRTAFGSDNHSNSPKEVKWCPPLNAYKLNVDGSSFGNLCRSGFRGLIRDELGQWCLGYSGFCGVTDNLKAELLAIHNRLKLAWLKGYKPLVCESDSKIAISMIQQGTHHLHPLAPLVNDIRTFGELPWQLSFNHVFREGNECADWLAKKGASEDSLFQLWESCPQPLLLVLLVDASGHVRLRV